ncbi:MAG: DNA polymerase III subunit delta [Selenomonas sp.]|nr:DNA polymerase III subunit delta [Selenomonas sp.]
MMADVKAGKVAPVYLLMGAENFFIDRLETQLTEALVPEGLRDWALITLFGADTDVETVVTTARGFPMGGDRMVVVLKEAQALDNFARLEAYLKQPQPTTVLIICYKNGTVDKRTKVYTLANKIGVVFEAEKVYENTLPAFIRNYAKDKGLAITTDAAQLMAAHIGTDLARITGELDKLAIALPEGKREITASLVADHIGVSKEFNIFELTDALAVKDTKKVFQIAKYFDSNPKANPIQRTLPQLFRFFQNIFLAYYAPDRSEHTLADYLGMRDWQVRRNVIPAMQRYKARKVMQILSAIRRTDARSKGIGNPSTSDGELLRELLVYILT